MLEAGSWSKDSNPQKETKERMFLDSGLFENWVVIRETSAGSVASDSLKLKTSLWNHQKWTFEIKRLSGILQDFDQYVA